MGTKDEDQLGGVNFTSAAAEETAALETYLLHDKIRP